MFQTNDGGVVRIGHHSIIFGGVQSGNSLLEEEKLGGSGNTRGSGFSDI